MGGSSQILLEIWKVWNLRIFGKLIDKYARGACVLCFKRKRLFLKNFGKKELDH